MPPLRAPAAPIVTTVADLLRAGREPTDAEFDAVYPTEIRAPSWRFWTPVAVATRAAIWLTSGGATRVLDVGAGPGKLCLIGAATTDATFCGVEHREPLVTASRRAAHRLGLTPRTAFLHGSIDDVDLARFDALYFYNPFGENLHPDDEQLDAAVELNAGRYERDVERVERALDAVRVGTRIVTYNGFGGRVPDTFELVTAKRMGSSILRLWHKAQPHSSSRGWYVEGAMLSSPLRE